MFLKMKYFNILNDLILSLILFCISISSLEVGKCVLHDSTPEKLAILDRLSNILGESESFVCLTHSYQVSQGDYQYAVSICKDTSRKHANASATKVRVGNETQVLGYRNDTDVIGGDGWIMLTYSGGEPYLPNSSCTGRRKASVFIMCDEKELNDESSLRFLEENTHPGCCGTYFELRSSLFCTTPKQKGLSNGSLFALIFFSSLLVYLILGVLYRRVILNAEGCQQLPNFNFWSKIGSLLADGCNFLCRCDVERDTSWNNITSNFDTQDRDDALLRP